MAIETGSTQSGARPTAVSDTSHAKGKAGAHGAGAPGGFMAILASLDGMADGGGAIAGAADALLAGQAFDPKAAHGKGGGRGAGKGDGLALGKDGGLAAGAQDPMAIADADAGKLTASTATDDAAQLVASTDASGKPDAALDPAALLALSAQWSAATAPSPEQAKAALPANAVTVAVAGAKPASVPDVRPDNAVAATPNPFSGGVQGDTKAAGKAHKDAAARLALANAAQDASSAANVQGDPRALQQQAMAKMAEQQPTAALAAAQAAVASTAAPAHREEQPRERSGFRASVSDTASMSATYSPAGASLSAQGVADAAPTPTDTYVAEKVAYWISNDVQNAELKLNGIGEKPVEVSIRMQGNEAHIAFRTDELQARTALENAGVHLKDLLQREGLVLSGVSVGSSGAGGAGGAGDQERGSRQGGRQSFVASVQPAGIDRGVGAARVTTGALDLFV